eukprot:g8450.t1
MFGLSLPEYLHAAKYGGVTTTGKDVSCIFLFLAGGPSHFETWDPKPHARDGVRSMWNPTATNVPGTFIIEKMPLLAQLADKYALIRSWRGDSNSHAAGSQHVMSGVLPPRGGQHFPNMGCVVTSLLGVKQSGISPHVGLPVDGRYTKSPAYLGPAFSSFDITDDPSSPDFRIDGLTLPRTRFDGRKSLLDQIDNLGRLAETNHKTLTARDKLYEEAFTTLTSGAMQKAANLKEEPRALREKYGMNIYGQRVLLARRLIEAGSRFGERVALLGKSGSGKSTLMNLLGGLDRPTSGNIEVDGNTLHRLTAKHLARYRMQTVGMIFQSFNLIASQSALQNVELPLVFAGELPAARRKKAEQALDRVGLAERVHHRPTELSGGEQQRVAIARALVNNPNVLLADEPTGNLDSDTTAEILNLLNEHVRAHGTTLVMVTHDEESAHSTTDRVLRMHDGRLVE